MAPSSPLLSRRALLGAGGSGLALLLASCATGPAGGDASGSGDAQDGKGSEGSGDAAGAFPVTVEHVYGSTEIPSEPQRVATVSWVNQDVCVALGVVPVGMAAVEFGGNANQSTDWFDAALEEIDGAERPVTWSEADGLDVQAIAAAEPDLILAVYSGITQEDYDRLSKIAPTVAYPKDVPAFGTPWQQSTVVIGRALGREDRAKELVADLERQIADAGAEHEALQGATFVYGTVDPAAADQISIYTDVDNRPQFLEQLGMEQAEVVRENSPQDQEFFFTWSPERADELESDVFVSWAAAEDVRQRIESDPLLGTIPAVESGGLVLQVDQQQVLSVSAISPLSIPYALKEIVPPIADAAARAKG
ncbi:iron-siderophore ABC transporter substrate-binding protein [Micrococcus sp. FDAARGOS_333]|uniref:iron-siderophore ABC transporter substrate-binding protein n=1 Tax=Micrococcus sp. FDAARGOS_333 TaxID=1930558 RepID=UPI000B4DF46B|nr:iron-siderophore ABC transporter substrate-binding protein [Micrococcus sp. FDAARGOS_333]PNL16910.1 iron-siderophore ABC transporter substrate-binding protein [Micrococcus sp. FDAARGOS_333]